MVLAERRSEELKSAAVTGKKAKNPARRWVARKIIVNIIILSFCLIVVNLIIQSLVVKRIREIKDLQAEISSLARNSDKLRVEMAELESFSRIQAIAQKDLGMRPAGPNDYQCIAAAPGYKKEKIPAGKAYSPKTIPKDSIWNQLVSWLGGTNKTMAQTP